jgi:hypothetical protein
MSCSLFVYSALACNKEYSRKKCSIGFFFLSLELSQRKALFETEISIIRKNEETELSVGRSGEICRPKNTLF